MKDRDVKRLVIWLLGGVTIIFLLSGFGITAPDLVTPLTLGVFSEIVLLPVAHLSLGPVPHPPPAPYLPGPEKKFTPLTAPDTIIYSSPGSIPTIRLFR